MSLQEQQRQSSKEVLEPSARMRKLVEMSHNITVDRNISISKYFNSGRELIKSAAIFALKGDIEKAFVLYLRYMTLFIEKLIHHPEYKKADQAEKNLVKEECNNVFERAESLKKQIIEKFTKEYEASKSEPNTNKEISADSDKIQKRSIGPEGSMPTTNNCDIDEIDRKFDFSQQPSDCKLGTGFDPFNIEELKRSFDVTEE